MMKKMKMLSTLPETNIAPENKIGFPKRNFIFQTIDFQGRNG